MSKSLVPESKSLVPRSEEHTSELQSLAYLVCRLLLEKKKKDVLTSTNAGAPLQVGTKLPGRFPDTEWFTPYTNLLHQFFRVRAERPYSSLMASALTMH